MNECAAHDDGLRLLVNFSESPKNRINVCDSMYGGILYTHYD
jgi:hypothetical protein